MAILKEALGDDNNWGHKRYLSWLLEYLKETEGPNKVWENIKDVIIKSLITVQPSLSHAYRASRPHDIENSHWFEVLGFDIILDRKLKPWLLEVNHSPSFSTDSDLDYDLKLSLITDTIKLLGLSPSRKAKYKKTKLKEMDDRKMGVQTAAIKKIKEAQREDAWAKRLNHEQINWGNYELIYPSSIKENNIKYERYLEESKKIWEKFTGSYRPPVKISTPSIKKKEKADTVSTLSTTTKNSKIKSTKSPISKTKTTNESSKTVRSKSKLK